MAGLIGNTEASGQVGGKVATLLAARGHRQRLIVPDASKAPDLPAAETSILADESGSQALQAALAGVDTVFLVPVRERPERRTAPGHTGSSPSRRGKRQLRGDPSRGGGPRLRQTVPQERELGAHVLVYLGRGLTTGPVRSTARARSARVVTPIL